LYLEKVSVLQVKGQNLKDLKQLEPGHYLEGVNFTFGQRSIPVYFASYIDNG